MIIIKVIHVCDICERRAMQRITLDDHMDISSAFANSNIIYKPEGWVLEVDGDEVDNQQRLFCPTCNKLEMDKICAQEKIINDNVSWQSVLKKIKKSKSKPNGADNDTTCMSFFT